jgi:RND family efflux transporter MFP subunit
LLFSKSWFAESLAPTIVHQTAKFIPLHDGGVSVRSFLLVGFGVGALVLAVCGGSSPSAKPGLRGWAILGSPSTDDGAIETVGRTQCVSGRRASIAPVPLHPVVEVLVAPGDNVKKGQILVKLDDDEAQADVRLKQALLDSAKFTANEARRFLLRAQSKQEVLPAQRLHEAELAVRKTEAEQRAAQAALDSSKAELEHFSVAAAIDGVVSWLDVQPGVVSRPGTSVWGEILNLRDLDVRCELTPRQADEVALGQPVEVRVTEPDRPITGRLVFIAPAADLRSGLVPVLVRLRNVDQRLRCGVSASVRFPAAMPISGSDVAQSR